ncbi:transferase family hexapeptide repeat protein [Ruminococcaceae bacterium R-25]|nr:transferase family hexapeptide repeat protein [Ruminococcaceae bacterium R-25]SUQ11285.1 transferase hexapeptide (six repeat-containing protein) [Oscillospiraceae bacterium]
MANLSFYIAKFFSRMNLTSKKNCNISKLSRVAEKCQLYNVNMDRYSYIGQSAVLSNVQIGQFCSIGGYGQIGGGMHPTELVSTSPCFLSGKSTCGRNFAQIPYKSSKTVVIENDVWIGVGVYIKAGVHIGNGAIIGAHSVVTHDVEPYSIVAGVPAKEIRKRFDEATIKKLLELKWWDFPEEKLDKYGEFFSSPELLFSYLANE